MSTLDKLRDYFDVVDIAPPDWPVRCCLALPTQAAAAAWGALPPGLRLENGRVAGGRGLSFDAAETSALGEAAELASAIVWGDEAVMPPDAPPSEGICWRLAELLGFSPDQSEARASWNERLDGTDWIPPAGTQATGWIMAEDAFGGDPVRVPADAVFLGTSASSYADTSGCAAGETDAAARQAAILELIERDATGRWWYGNRARAVLDTANLGPEFDELLGWFGDRGRNLRLFDITTDLGVPVVACVTDDPETGSVSIGFAAGLSHPVAAQKATSEMGQMALLVEAGLQTGQMRPGLRRWLAEVSPKTSPLGGVATAAPPRPAIMPDELLPALQQHGVRLAFHNMTLNFVGVSVWRAISPDLCHWKPRFGRARLLAPDEADLEPAAAAPNSVILRL